MAAAISSALLHEWRVFDEGDRHASRRSTGAFGDDAGSERRWLAGHLRVQRFQITGPNLAERRRGPVPRDSGTAIRKTSFSSREMSRTSIRTVIRPVRSEYVEPRARPSPDAKTKHAAGQHRFRRRGEPGSGPAQHFAALAAATAAFRNRAVRGRRSHGWAWTPIFLDVDLDGFEDLLVAIGSSRTE